MSKEEGPGPGHNVNKKAAEAATKEILKAFDVMESEMGTHRTKIKELYEKHADALGISRKLLRKEVGRIRRNKAQAAEEMELEATERDQIEAFRVAMEGTPFGEFAAGELAKSLH